MDVMKFRMIKNAVFKGLVIFFAFLTLVPLFLILFYLVKNGISSLNIDFFLQVPKPVGEEGGGIANAIVGSLLIVGMACAMSIPIGIATGIYLCEYRTSRLCNICRLAMEVLQSVPSIVIGIVVYAWIVSTMKHYSAFSGSIALGLMMLPMIAKSTEETMRLIPESLKEAAMALGVPYYRALMKVILPSAMPSIITGILLSVARVLGETAPLLFTAFGSPFMSTNINKPMNALPIMIYNYAMSPYPQWHKLAWGASFVLIMLVLAINLIAKGVTKKWKVQF